MEEIDNCRIDFDKAIESKGGYLVCSKKSRLIMKETSMPEWEILALSSIMDYIEASGFRNFITLKKDILGKPYYKNNERVFIICDYLEGSKLKLNTLDDGIKFSRFLAGFHNAAEGYVQPSGIRACVLWGKKTEEFRSLLLRFEKKYKFVKLGEVTDEFQKYIQENGEEILKRAKASMRILKSVGYLKTLENSMRKKEICLNKISNNVAVISNDEIILKKVFAIGYNMAEEDIALLVKKVAEETTDTKVCEPIFENYSEIRELDDNSLVIVKAFAAFPEETLKIIDKYYKSEQKDENDPAKLKKYWSRESRVNLLEV